MVTVEISTGLLVVLLLSFIIFLMMEYWFARCDVRRYQQWYEDMCHNWSWEMHENRKIKQQLYQREKEDDVYRDGQALFHTPDGRTFTDAREADKHIQQLWKQKEED